MGNTTIQPTFYQTVLAAQRSLEVRHMHQWTKDASPSDQAEEKNAWSRTALSGTMLYQSIGLKLPHCNPQTRISMSGEGGAGTGGGA